METATSVHEMLVRLDEALKIIPVSKSTWYRGIKTGIYPAPVKLSHRAAAWKMSELQACIGQLAPGSRRASFSTDKGK